MTWWAPHRRVWWTGLLFALGSLCFAIGPFPGFVQAVGTEADAAVFFNLSTWEALDETLSVSAENRLVWAPDALGSICFLVASVLALLPVLHEAGTERRIAYINLAGSIAFGISAIASYVVPSSGSVLDLAAANFTTVMGALCFLAGALPLMRQERAALARS